jgi:hypothetical protein
MISRPGLIHRTKESHPLHTNHSHTDEIKTITRTGLSLAACLAFAACAQMIAQPTETDSTPVDAAAVRTAAAASFSGQLTETALPSPAPTATPRPTQRPYPSAIPTIAAEKIPGRLQAELSVEKLAATNGHNLRRVTGWENGFKDYQWMDSKHLLLFPIVGEYADPFANTLDARPVVITLDTAQTWLPPADRVNEQSERGKILLPRWSPKLDFLITAETVGEGAAAKEGVSIYNSAGKLLKHYAGRLVDTSPSATKMLIADDTWVDLSTGKMVDFGWDFTGNVHRWLPIWSPDETRVYFCCYFYGNAMTSESYTIPDANLQTDFSNYPHHPHGTWLQDSYVLVQFDVNTRGSGFIPVYNTHTRKFSNLGKLANLPDEFNDNLRAYLSFSPNRDYMTVDGGLRSGVANPPPAGYLINLKTFKSQPYFSDVDWSTNGEFAIVDSKVLALSSGEIKALPAGLHCDVWHPTRGICATVSTDANKQQVLAIQDLHSMSVQKVPLPAADKFAGLRWSLRGDRIALTTDNGVIWQIDYPGLKNLEQLTPLLENMENLTWAPNGTQLSFMIGKDIYLVDASSQP